MYFVLFKRKRKINMSPINHHRHHHSSRFKPIRKFVFKSQVALRMIQGQKTKLNNQHEVLLPFSNQQLAGDRKTKRLVLLSAASPASQIKRRRNNHKRFCWVLRKTTHDLGNPNFFSSLHRHLLICFFRLVEKQQAKCSEPDFILGLLEQLPLWQPPSL